MSKVQSFVSELFIAKEDGRSTVRLFIASPTPLEEKNLGTLFAILEIESDDTINEDILNLIIDEVDAQYYASDAFEVEIAFEKALQKTNHKLQELIGEIGEEWLNTINIVIGVQREKELIFANLGRVIALMIYHNKIIDVLDSATAKAQEINPVKIFSNIVSGELPEEGTLIFATETILDYLSKEKIKRIVSEYSPEQASEQLYNVLSEDTTNTNFAALILKRERLESPTIDPHAAIPVVNQTPSQSTTPSVTANTSASISMNHTDSMNQLLGKQNKTEELLTSSIWPSIKKAFSDKVESIFHPEHSGSVPTEHHSTSSSSPSMRSMIDADIDDSASALDALDKQDATVSSPDRNANYSRSGDRPSQKTSSIPATILAILKKIGIVCLKGLRMIQHGIVLLIRLISQRSKHNSHRAVHTRSGSRISNSLQGATSKGLSRVILWFKSLTLIQKSFFIVAVVVILIFAQSVINKGAENTTEQHEDQYAQLISDIDLKINEGKAAVLYDGEGARDRFVEARDLLAKIPKDSETYKQRGSELENVINGQLKVLNNVITLENPSPLLDYTTVNPNIQLSHMILLGAGIYTFDANTQSVYRGNIENKETTVAIDKPDSNGFKTVTKASAGTGIAALKDNSAVFFNPVNQSLAPVELPSATNRETEITDMALYGTNRLYALDAKNNQIYRYIKNGERFSDGSAWVTGSDIDLSNAISIAIDGDIYVLKNNGEIMKLTSGEKNTAFTAAQIDPALTGGEHIYTDETMKNIYVLDAKNQRVIIFGKDGKLISQYTSTTFTGLKDMVVDEANKKIYLLNDAKVYEVQIQDQPGT